MTFPIIPPPADQEDRTGPDLWIDEAIWGHRLHDEQTPWLAFLEFLGVLNAEDNQGRALVEGQLNTLAYSPKQQLRLRNILFNNPHLLPVQRASQADDQKWNEWLLHMKSTAGGLETPDFSYLKQHFHSFEDFAAVVEFLQSSAIEGNSNKRWSSKFVFPFGRNSLYEDLKVSATSSSNDRRFFGRTGELLYLMLARAAPIENLRPVLVNRLLQGEGPYDHLVKILQGAPDHKIVTRAGSFLPAHTHHSYDQLAEDWLRLLSLHEPAYDIIPHLVTMAGLNIIGYQLERARAVLDRPEPIQFIWEIIGPRRNKVRELSEQSYRTNAAMSVQAIEHYIRSVTELPDWQAACEEIDPRTETSNLLKRLFGWEEMDQIIGGPPELLEALVEQARKRHNDAVGKFHGVWCRQIGMASRRASRSTRYAPTDRLLKTLVITCVDVRQEFNEFLQVLYDRYGIIIGDQQAAHIIATGNVDHQDFSDNKKRLEDRLKSLGLLERFSDACAYVKNPFESKRI